MFGPKLINFFISEKQYLRFDDVISTSNTYGDVSFQREGVTVKTDKGIIWSMSTR